MAKSTPEQMFEFYKARITEVLSKYNPSGLKTLDSLLKQFPGKEHQVYKQMCKLWKVEPLPPPTAADFKKKFPLKEVGMKDEEVSIWLREKGFDMYSTFRPFQTITMKDFMTMTTKVQLMELGVIELHAEALLTEIRLHQKNQKNPQMLLPRTEDHVSISEFKVGENCYTKMLLLNSNGGEKWLGAKITHVNDNDTYDISVYNAKNYGVPPDAVNVPRTMLKRPTENVDIAIPDPKRKIKRPQFQYGSRVRVFGLRSHTTYNGLCGTVLLYVPSERRYQVRLDTNDVIAIKQRNVGPIKKGDDKSMGLSIYSSARTLKKFGNEEAYERVLSALMLKLMHDNPDTDAGKLGEFAAGYLLAKKKQTVNKTQKFPSNIS